MDVQAVFGQSEPVVGMVHLPPLPEAPRYEGDREALRGRVRSDAEALATAGVDAVLVENFGDAPFYPDDVPKHVVASMTDLAREVTTAVGRPVGVNVLRNDAAAAMAVAAAVDAAFIRVNVHLGARVADQGVLEGRAHDTLRLRDRLDADVAVLAGLAVKHSSPLATDVAEEAVLADMAERGLADGIIVTGRATGHAPPRTDLEAVVSTRDQAGLELPVFVGSGVTPANIADTLSIADGVIVGSSLKAGGEPLDTVDPSRVRALLDAAGR